MDEKHKGRTGVRTIIGPLREEVTGQYRKLQNEETHNS
jgi:hypothetical protein